MSIKNIRMKTIYDNQHGLRQTSRVAFTLIELLLVISIISLLASIVFASVNSARAKARDARRLADAYQIVIALELYYDNHGQYPEEGCNGQALPYGECESGPPPGCEGGDQSHRDLDGDSHMFIDILAQEALIPKVPVDPLNSGNCTSGALYRYHRYLPGDGSCDSSRGEFFVLGINEMETSIRPHSSSPGWACKVDTSSNPLSTVCAGGGVYGANCRNWQTEFDWVIGRYER